MAMLKYGHASVVKASIMPSDWTETVYKSACSDGKCRMKTAGTIVAKYSPQKYLLSHCSIIAAVDVDMADPNNPKSGYLIKPEFSDYVNNNGDAWTKEVLKSSYETFIGGENYQEHVQIPELSKGKIIDAALREIPIGKNKEGADLSTYYVDILVATDRSHKDLVRKIEARELTTLSMGCVIAFSICTKCGNRAVDESEACTHVRYQKNSMFFDPEYGVQRRIAELCGHKDEPGSVKFIEASWVKQPAFTGAVLRDFVAPSNEILAKFEKAEQIKPYVRQEGDFMKAASDLIAADPPADEPPPPPEDTPPEDAPPEDAPPEDAPPEDTSPEDAPPEDTSPEDAPPDVGDVPGIDEVPSGMEEDEFKSWKNDLKKQVLRQISDEVLKNLSDDDISAPREDETIDDTLIKPASLVLKKVWGAQKSWDRYVRQKVGSIDKKNFDKLRYGVHMAMTNNDLTILKDFGYNKRDFLAVLSFIDGCMKEPLPIQAKKVIAELGGIKNRTARELLLPVVTKIGRKLTPKEAKRIISWLKFLDYYS